MVMKFNLNVDNGGTPISLFELEAKDSANLVGSFVKIASYPGFVQTHTLDLLVDTQLTAGVIYDFRFRAKNLIGYSVYSDYLR